MTRADEWELLRVAAEMHGVDPYFLGAIRLVENGGPGKEMGVLNADAATFEAQASVAAKTVRNRLAGYNGNPLVMRTVLGRSPYRRLAYGDDWIEWFGERWAPVGVHNDPTNLNLHWVPNCQRVYADVVSRGAWP